MCEISVRVVCILFACSEAQSGRGLFGWSEGQHMAHALMYGPRVDGCGTAAAKLRVTTLVVEEFTVAAPKLAKRLSKLRNKRAWRLKEQRRKRRLPALCWLSVVSRHPEIDKKKIT